jgi:acyl-CoA synthetase (AMP-forming)/AMP-acid ligase II
VLTNTYYLNNGKWYAEVGGLVRIRPGKERMLTPLPLFHMNAMATSTMAMMMSGGCLTVLDRFHPRSWWDSVRAARATIVHYLGVMPPMLMGAPASPDDRNHHVVFGFGAGVDKRLHGPFEERFGFPLVEAWAMTETGGAVIICANKEPRHLGVSCIGKPDDVTELQIIREDGSECAVGEPGELLVRRKGPNPRYGFVKEYLKDPAATEEAWAGGYFHTGDVVRQDSDGYIYFVDRRKNVIRRSGENIAAVEVESVLQQHPAVAAVAVAATPDEVRGDEVFACVVAKEPPADEAARKALAADLVHHVLSRLAYYKAPGYVAFVSALPVTATQKIQRGALKELVADLAKRPDTIDTRTMKKRQG